MEMIKKLPRQFVSKPAIKLHLPEKSENAVKAKCNVTHITVSERDACELVRKKLFLIRPQIHAVELCYVPCWWVVLDFSVVLFRKSNKIDGTLELVVDEIKGCSVADDPKAVKMEKKNIDAAMLLPHKFNEKQAETKAIVDARWKIIMARYRRPPELRTVSIREFYRPYYEVKFSYGKDEKTQWIPADAFANYFTYN